MLLHFALVIEILATIMCIHRIYGRKIRLDINTVGTILGILIILELANSLQFGGILSFSVYVVLFMYCKKEFKCSLIENVISLVLCMIIMTSMQFMFSSIIRLKIEQEYVRNAVSNILVLVFLAMSFTSYGMHSLQKALVRKSSFVAVLAGFMCLIVLLLLLQGKVLYGVHMQYFTLVVPAIFMILYSIIKWYSAQAKVEKMEEEICRTKENEKKYEMLLTKVRLRQHELKNHIAAVFSAHYTHKTYEKLVQAQEEYCSKILSENKYNNLLLLGDNVLVGFLYGKFQEAEADGIEIQYKVAANVNRTQVPTYYVIEMLGILFNNAVEALKNSAERVISMEFCEADDGYEFSIRNPFPYVSYDEILGWFEPDKSEKGSGRGLGLYHLKCLCEEWKCDISFRNIEIEWNNWIEFTLKLSKADNE